MLSKDVTNIEISLPRAKLCHQIYVDMIILEQLCEYKIKQGGDYENNKLIRSIQANRYINNQQCWASFKCPSDLNAYWRRVNFNTEKTFDQVRFYGENTDQHRIYSGDLGWSSNWHTLLDNEIIFEFKADRSENDFRGFEFYLTCK